LQGSRTRKENGSCLADGAFTRLKLTIVKVALRYL